MSDCCGLIRCQTRLGVVVLPRALEAKAETAPQNIRLRERLIRDAHRRSILPVKHFRLLALLRVEIEVPLHAAGHRSRVRLTAICPECSQEALATLGSRLKEGTAPARTGRIGRTFETVKGELAPPGGLRPFHPYALSRHVEQICTGECARPFRVGERGTQARQFIAEDISRGALGNVFGKLGRTTQLRDSAVLRALDDAGSATLRDAIGQSHPAKVAASATGSPALG